VEFGVVFTSRVGDFDRVQLAESLGFDQAWFYDSQMIYSDVYATMALAAHETRRIRLGTGVAVPSTRMAPVIAHSIATVAKLAPGRVELGVGNGNTARLTMGLRPVPLERMKRDIRLIQTLLRGETGWLEEEGERNAVRFLHPNRGFLHLDDPIPITLSAFGPKTMAFCGAECDAHLSFGLSPDGLRDARSQIDAAAMSAGRPAGSVPTKAFYALALLRPGEDAGSERIVQSLEAFMTNFLHVQIEWDEGLLPLPPHLAGLIERYRKYAGGLDPETRHLVLHEGHLIYARQEEREFLEPALAESVAMVGEPDAVIEQIRALEAEGLQHFAFQVTDDPVGQMRDFAQLVMARYR
jgi:alkanesulfonate monooxygenase SsuD/methylene tetrahydromethanopterin reductase-like flavin-dependent oxidoreductase (luciferase family)